MRWSCSGPLSRRLGLLVLAVLLPGAAPAQTALETLRALDPPDAVLRYTMIGRETALQPWDIAAIELSESGGITDVFVRLEPEAAATLAAMTELATGMPMTVRICGHTLSEGVVEVANTTGTLYLPDTNAVRGEAIRALWQGRARCDTLGPEVFPDGN